MNYHYLEFLFYIVRPLLKYQIFNKKSGREKLDRLIIVEQELPTNY